MPLLDRYIVLRFLTDFLILFVLLYVFAAAIDLVLALDRFVDAARAAAGEGAGPLAITASFFATALQFQGPRFFQFYAYLHGLVSIGAMGFTLTQMHRRRELVAILSAGVSLHRVAMPFVVAAFGISIVQLLNQELILPRVAPLLMRDHGHIGQTSVDEYPVSLTRDGRGTLFQSPRFDPRLGELLAPTILERDDRGRTVRRITADRARWGTRSTPAGEVEGWALVHGTAVTLAPEGSGAGGGAGSRRGRPVDFVATDLSPRRLIVLRYGQFAAMLSLGQIKDMLENLPPDEPGTDALRRYRYARFATVLVNVLVMWLALPTFLLREPANLMIRAMLCAGVAIGAMIGAAVFMVMELPGIKPAVGVFLPVVILMPIVLAQWTYVRT